MEPSQPIDTEQKPIAIRFTRSLDLKIIDCTKPIPFEADKFINADKWSDEELSNCIALVPVTYIEAGEYINVLPCFIPVYSWGYGSSTIDITRTYKDKPTRFRLVGDVVWAKISQSLSSNYREQHKKENSMPDKQEQPTNTEPKTISYPEAFFYDVTSQARIDSESDEIRHNVEVVYNSFKDKIHMDTESRISITRENILALEYFQLFMLVMHEMNFFWRVRMAENDAGPERVTFVFNQILTEFCRFACHIRNYPNDASTWDEMEVSLHDIQNKVSELHYAVGSYLYEDANTNNNQKIVMNKDGTPFIMPSDDETEDNEPGDNLKAKFKDQMMLQNMELARMNWATKKIMIVVQTTVNICVAVVFAFIFARIWCFLGSIEDKDKYKLDDSELGGIFLALTIIIILNNIKTINKWIKELANNG